MVRSAGTPPTSKTSIDRKLPQSVEAEQYVIGSMLLEPDVVPGLLQLLSAEDFYSTRHQKIFEAIEHLYDQLSTIDPLLVRDHLDKQGLAGEVGDLEYLEELMLSVSTVANAEYHARSVREKAILRQLVAACTEIIRNAYEGEESGPDQLDKAEQQILEIGRSGGAAEFVSIDSVIDEQFNRLDQRQRGQVDGLLTGFHDLDRLTTGLHPAELIVVAGRPSMGKTSFAMNVVDNVAAAGKSVAIFSLEVSRDQLVQNLLCSFSRVDAQRFRKNELSDDDWQALVDGAHKLRQMSIYIDDTSSLTPLNLKAKARRLHTRHPFDLLVLDYLQLMSGPAGVESRQQEVSLISRSLKGLARELNVPVIAISQLSRGVESRESHRPRLSDLRESGAIEQDADLVLLLYREEYYKPDKQEAKGLAEVIIAKQRNGPTDTVNLTFMNRFMKFENLARHTDQPF